MQLTSSIEYAQQPSRKKIWLNFPVQRLRLFLLPNDLPGSNLEFVDHVPIIAPPENRRERCLAAKRDKLGHRFPPDATPKAS